MHACLTLDGVGGRLEQLQDEAGLSHLQWEARFEQTPEVMALVMSTTATPVEVARLWQLYERARRSLVEVPPSASELQIALRRARLNAGDGTFAADVTYGAGNGPWSVAMGRSLMRSLTGRASPAPGS